MNNISEVYEGYEPFIFISYAHRDSERVYEFINQLRADGYRVWFDDGIHVSEDFAEKIASRIVESTFFISMVSDGFLASEWCLDELAFAKNEKAANQRFLIYLDNIELPPSLRLQYNRIQNLKMWETGERTYKKLYSVYGIDACKKEQQDVFPEKKQTNEKNSDAEDKLNIPFIKNTQKNTKAETKVYSNKGINVGDIISFGRYPQKTDGTVEEISWKVLAVEGQKALIISEYGLDCQSYNNARRKVTWEKSSIRNWINSSFISKAFTEDEVDKIIKSTVTADNNPESRTNPGNNTEDQVFLLSIAEVEKYLSSYKERKCVPTEYAIANGAFTSRDHTYSGKVYCWWWLRSPGKYSSYAADVYHDGSVYCNGHGVDDNDGCVRPALWINL